PPGPSGAGGRGVCRERSWQPAAAGATRGARAGTPTAGDQRRGSRAHLRSRLYGREPSDACPTRRADRTDLSWRDTQLIRRQIALMRIEGVVVAHIYAWTGIVTHALPALRVKAMEPNPSGW